MVRITGAKSFGGIVGQAFEHRDIAGLRRVGSHQQGVTVRRAARDLLRAETAERAAAVLDHDRLSQLFLQALADQARDLIGTGAGGKRHDDLDLPRRIVVGGVGVRPRKSEQDQTGENVESQLHPVSSSHGQRNLFTDF
jgi:hypothetical protein